MTCLKKQSKNIRIGMKTNLTYIKMYDDFFVFFF